MTTVPTTNYSVRWHDGSYAGEHSNVYPTISKALARASVLLKRYPAYLFIVHVDTDLVVFEYTAQDGASVLREE